MDRLYWLSLFWRAIKRVKTSKILLVWFNNVMTVLSTFMMGTKN
ncbi:hypothetical protein [Campylobacter sp. RM16190]|nr:hypothetical protein [Campylobacter sp. RM16190]